MDSMKNERSLEMHGDLHEDGQSEPVWIAEHTSLYTAATGVKSWFARPGTVNYHSKLAGLCAVFRAEGGLHQATCQTWHAYQSDMVEPSSQAMRLKCPMGMDLLWAPVAREQSLYGCLYTEPVLSACRSAHPKPASDKIPSPDQESAGPPKLSRHALSSFLRILRVNVTQRDGLLLLLELVAQRLVGRFYEEERLSASLGAAEALIRRAQAVLCSRYHDDISTRDVADELHVSESHLCHTFQSATGGTLRQHLNDLRFNEACRLLRNYPCLTVAEVAFSAGFRSLSRFSEQFRRRNMPSPGKWRHSQEQPKPNGPDHRHAPLPGHETPFPPAL
jgi:AraC-like DNA-binding protein